MQLRAGYARCVDPVRSPNSKKLLITAGPTHEPIDSVRFIGNRSSGRLGIDLATVASARGWDVTLLLGPTSLRCDEPRVRVRPFVSVNDLQALLREEFRSCDVLVMAAAVADYRPKGGPLPPGEKLKRTERGLVLELESTPDLLAGVATMRRPGQALIGFALEPEERLLASAREKLARKGVDAIVANPLRTMDAPDIEATLVRRDGESSSTDGRISKAAFASWLLDRIESLPA